MGTLTDLLKSELASEERVHEESERKGRKATTNLIVDGAVVATLARIARAVEKWESENGRSVMVKARRLDKPLSRSK